ncbi:hypothetical protein PHSC3_000010 [Chlamydiales bacterium STE3]|nr:hypothetical protein PHSC3_000010 [Chlamydiales bacterium STE3]
MNRISCLNHIKHPFSEGQIRLSSKQKKVTLLATILLIPFLFIPGIVAFYGISYYFKGKNIKSLNSLSLPKLTKITSSIGAAHFSDKTKKQSQSLPFTDSKIKLGSRDNSLGTESRESFSGAEDSSDEDDSQPNLQIQSLPLLEDSNHSAQPQSQSLPFADSEIKCHNRGNSLGAESSENFFGEENSSDDEDFQLSHPVDLSHLPPLVSDSDDEDLSDFNANREKEDDSDQDVQMQFQMLASLDLKVEGLDAILSLLNERQNYLTYLHDNQSNAFKKLFIEVLRKEENDLLTSCLKLMNRAELDEILKDCSNFKLKFDDKEIPFHKTILMHFFGDYFKLLFNSGLREVGQSEMNFPEDELELFDSILNALMFNEQFEIGGDNLAGYLEVSEKYLHRPVKTQCEEFMIRNFTEFTDFSEVFRLADKYHLEDFKTEIQRLANEALKEEEINEPRLAFLSQFLPYIQKLKIVGSYNRNLLSQCIGLKELKIESEDKTFLEVLGHFQHLEYLDIKGFRSYEPLYLNKNNVRGYLVVSKINKDYFLKRQCEEFMICNLTDFTDFSEVFKLADEYNLKDLKTDIQKVANEAVKEKEIDPSRWNFFNQFLSQILRLEIKGFYNPDMLSQYVSLKELRIESEDKTFLGILSHFSNLKHLKIASLTLKDDDLEVVKEMQLTTLELSGCELITDDGLAHLKGLPLKNLYLGGCKRITDKGLVHLKGNPLKELNLSGCESITAEGLMHLKGMLLKKLDLSRVKCITDEGLAHLEGVPLRSLNLSSCVFITDKGLAHLEGMPLRSLNLSFCIFITDKGLIHLEGMPLRSLNLSLCGLITDEGLVHLEGMPLKELDLSSCRLITDNGLAHLEGMPLRSLNLSLCSLITDEGLVHLEGMPLQYLALSGNRLITDEGLAQLEKALQVVDNIYLIISSLSKERQRALCEEGWP